MDAHPPGPMANLADPQIKQEIKQEPNDEDDFELAKQLTMNADMEIVQEMFSGIEPKHVENLWKSKLSMQSAQAIIDHLLDEVDKGHPWPKIEKPQISLKRKRSVTSEGEEDYKATHPDRITASYLSVAKHMLMHDFPYIHGKFISNTFKEQNYRFYDAYLKLEELSQLYSENNKTYKRNSAQRKLKFEMDFGEDAVTRIANNGQLSIDATYGVQVTLLFKDLYHARLAKFKIQEKIDAERAEAKNLEDSLAAGDMEMCGCCFVEHPMNRMVYCNSTSAVHLFCKSCLTTHAETEVGKGLYKLECISMDNCLGGFAKDQRLLFLTPKLMETMEQLELEESLRLAGIENLETCPFCPYAAEYPPIEENRIFQCARDECMISSCRNCRKEQHIPLTCEEHAKTLGAEHHRHQIEDLMSEALLRKCNKCATPFIKSDGCNKIRCMKCNCLMCYICRKTITDYSHFNDETRGGKNGQCTLFDRTEDRHQEEVENAKKAAIATILTEHPEFKDVDLDITQTAAEKEDRERRLRRDPLHMDYQRLMAEAGVAVPGGDNLLGYPIYQRLYGVVGGVLPGIPPPAPRPGVPRAAGAPEPPEAPRPGIAQLRPVVGGAGPAIGGGGQPNVPIAQLHNHIFPAPNPPLMRHPHRLRADGPRVPAFAAFVEEEDLAIVEGARLAPFQVEVGVRLQERLNRLERRYFGDRDLDPRIRFAVDRRAEPLPLRDPLGAAEVIDNGLPDRRGRLRDLVHARLRGLPQQRNLLGHPQDDDPGDVPDPI